MGRSRNGDFMDYRDILNIVETTTEQAVTHGNSLKL